MTFNVFSFILMALFGACILISYLYVRRGQASPLLGGVNASVFNVVVISLFALSVGNDFPRAVITGLVFGIIFGVLSVSAAYFFRRNELSED